MEKNRQEKKSSIRYLLLLYITLFVLAIPLVLLSLPDLKKSIEESRILEHYSFWRNSELNKERKAVTVVLESFNGLVETERIIHPGLRDQLHYTIEALLMPLSVEEKEAGLVSNIEEGVSLIGATVSDKIAFVTLSSEFLSSADISQAADEINKTLAINLGTEGLVIIVDDNVLIRK